MMPKPQGTVDVEASEVICHSTENKEYSLFKLSRFIQLCALNFSMDFKINLYLFITYWDKMCILIWEFKNTLYNGKCKGESCQWISRRFFLLIFIIIFHYWFYYFIIIDYYFIDFLCSPVCLCPHFHLSPMVPVLPSSQFTRDILSFTTSHID